MLTYFFKKYTEYRSRRREKSFLWDMIGPYRRPKSFTPMVTVYVAAFYTGVVGAAITEQLYKVVLTLYLNMMHRIELSGLGKMNYVLDYHEWFNFYVLRNHCYPTLHEKYWEEHPGEAVPLMRPKYYFGPWKVRREDHLPPTQ
ncbi:hypothetical protein GIB67_026344 [Kingdonia uniflora]|uniref:Uncharacterized protein n=1 Tax=Kingdonia uniflora TaxID=39325 RepID=A0A7J7P5X9_9MAGN|nr:hypothetical protein GIB67_026344 [Kingdonia uniflora]